MTVHVEAGSGQQTSSLTNSPSYILSQSFSLEIRSWQFGLSNWPIRSAVPLALPPTPWDYRQSTMPARHCVQTVELWSICLHSRHFIYRVPKLVTFLFFPIHGTFVHVSFFYFLFVYLFYILVVASFLFLPSQSLFPTPPPIPQSPPLLSPTRKGQVSYEYQ